MILVTGATGNIGREVVRFLLDRGMPVRALTRDPQHARLPESVDVVRGDLADSGALAQALRGVTGALLNVFGDPTPLADALRSVPIRSCVLISSITAETRPTLTHAASFRRSENVIKAAAPGLTILRPGQFASNVLWWKEMMDTGTVRVPFANVPLPTIDPFDIAAVAATILLEHSHPGEVLHLSGPDRLSPRAKVGILAAILRRTLRLEDLSEAEYRLANADASDDFVDYFVAVNGHPTLKELTITSAVQDVLGRPATPFHEWAERHQAALTSSN